MLAQGPYQPTSASPEWDPARRGEESGDDPRHFAEMVRYRDEIVGRMVARRERRGLRERTLILFPGDNGTGRGISSRFGDRAIDGGKGRTTDAGRHVPLIVNWRGTVAPGVCADRVDSTDFVPTLAAAAGVAPPANMLLDGRSVLPQLRGEPGRPRDWASSWYCPRPDKDPALRECAWDRRFKRYRTGELFDRTTDFGEERPISPGERTGDAAAAANVLQAALDQFAGIRPAAFVAEGPDDGP